MQILSSLKPGPLHIAADGCYQHSLKEELLESWKFDVNARDQVNGMESMHVNAWCIRMRQTKSTGTLTYVCMRMHM